MSGAAIVSIEKIVSLQRCRDCRWWTDEGIEHDGPGKPTWGECGRFHPGFGERDSRATAYGDFQTAPDFGCVQFQAREGEDSP